MVEWSGQTCPVSVPRFYWMEEIFVLWQSLPSCHGLPFLSFSPIRFAVCWLAPWGPTYTCATPLMASDLQFRNCFFLMKFALSIQWNCNGCTNALYWQYWFLKLTNPKGQIAKSRAEWNVEYNHSSLIRLGLIFAIKPCFFPPLV